MAVDWQARAVGDWKALRLFFLDLERRKVFFTEFDRRVGLRAHGFRSEVRSRIRAKKYAPNAALTVAIKGSSTPLVDYAVPGLLSSVVATRERPGTWFVGVKRGTKHGDDEDFVNVAEALHDGFTITWTRAVRTAVMARMTERRRKESKALAAANRAGERRTRELGDRILVVGRPYIGEPWEDGLPATKAGLARDFKHSLEIAVRRTSPRGPRR